MWIQIVLVVAIVLIGVFLARPAGGDNHLALRRIFMFGFVIVAIASVLFPQWLTWLAHLIGVGRGTDLLLYALVLAFLVFVASTYRRNVQLNRRLTLLAREVALTRAEADDAKRESEASAAADVPEPAAAHAATDDQSTAPHEPATD